MKKLWMFILAITWELPQTLISVMLLPFTDFKKNISKKLPPYIIYRVWLFGSASFSLGHFIFMSINENDKQVYRHEYGHSMQSRYLGPLYLLVVALPSCIQYGLSVVGILSWENYYFRFPENWAQRLGGNKR